MVEGQCSLLLSIGNCSDTGLIGNQSLLFISYVTLGKFLTLSDPRLTCLIVKFKGLNEIIHRKDLVY